MSHRMIYFSRLPSPAIVLGMKNQHPSSSAAPQSILIRNATIVNEGRQIAGDVLVRNGRIDRIDGQINATADLTIDATGKTLLPGMVDCHVHFREPGLTHKADIRSESAAAVAGGVTSVMEMPNTTPTTVTNERLEDKFALAADKMLTNYSFYLGASLGNLDEVKAVDPQNVCGVKVYMGSSTGDMLVDRLQTLENLFKECPINLTAHCEDSKITSRNEKAYREKYGAEIPFSAHPLIRSEEACYVSSKQAIELAQKYNTLFHILHISTGKELDLFEATLAAKGKNITGEACVHHLFFNDSLYDEKGSFLKCNPAIKSEADRLALLNGLLTNQLDTIGTDHAPHTLEEKDRPYSTAPSGMPVIQYAMPSVLEHYHNQILSLEQIVEKTAHAPSRIFNVVDRGYIREGYWADLVLVDLNQPTPVSRDTILSKCGWSPFEGTTFRSRIDTTIVSGHVAWKNQRIDAATCGQRLRFNR
jgi:dihydroorotase